jgi:hypothetical protein
MLEEDKSVMVIAKSLGIARDCIRMKIAGLGVEVVVQPKSERTTTTSAKFPDGLPTIEDVMKVLSNALTALRAL